jgi:ubiquinone/menaquinone biosynthesis C-methylase UbiE
MRTQGCGTLASTVYRWIIDPLLAPLRPKTVRLCLKHGLDSVLDIGTATGAQCRALATAGIHAIGLDLSEAMITAAKARPSGNIEYVVGSAYDLPFTDASIRAVLLSLALHEHSEKERSRMLIEAVRVLEPGGHLILTEYSQPGRPCCHIPWLIIQLIENLAGGDHRAGFHQFMKTGGLKGLLKRHGLRASEVAYSHFHTLAIAVIPINPQDLESQTPTAIS